MNRKEKLISSLKIAINALKNDIIHYDWHSQQSCNCGVVSQAILGYNAEQVNTLFEDVRNGLKEFDTSTTTVGATWRNGIKYLCPITGKSNIRIFDELVEAGLSKEDIVHLEFMDNPAIIAKSGIKTEETITNTVKQLVETKKTKVVIPHPNFFKRFLGKTKEVEEVSDFYRTVENSYQKNIDDFHKNKSNLILYLQAWVEILEGGSSVTNGMLSTKTKTELEGELIVALADENYEYAATLRDNINKLT